MKQLTDALEKLNIDSAEEKTAILESYMEEILRLNESINLTAITDREEFVQKHFIDSLLCADSREFLSADTVIDVGTGGGFPGVPLAVAFPGKSFVLMDSLNKRVKIVQELCDRLGIKNVVTVHGRAEELARQKGMRESFDACVSRAVANMSTLSEYCIPFVKEGGWFIAYKGPGLEEEMETAGKAIEILGGEMVRTDTPAGSDRISGHRLVYVRKAKATPKTYPRKAGVPGRKPLGTKQKWK